MKKASVVITRFNESDKLLTNALISISKQEKCFLDVYMLDQKYSSYIDKICQHLNTKTIKFYYKNILPKGLSYAKNMGIKFSKSSIILFFEPDLSAPNNYWAYKLIISLSKRNNTAIVCSKILPKWEGSKPILAYSNILKEQFSLLDLGEKNLFVNKVLNGGINKTKLKKLAYFNENLGRKNNNLIGGEETDLCQRAINSGFNVQYIGSIFLYHLINKNRCNNLWILKRIYYAGLSRGFRGGKIEATNKKRNVYDIIFLPLYLPLYLLGLIISKFIKK